MKKLAVFHKMIIISLFIVGIFFNSVAYALQPQVVLFCSGWNLKCRDARKACSSAASDLGMKFLDLDIDLASSEQKAIDLGLTIPSSIPYIYIFDNNGDLVKGKFYTGETAQDLKQGLLKF